MHRIPQCGSSFTNAASREVWGSTIPQFTGKFKLMEDAPGLMKNGNHPLNIPPGDHM
jgi:hypothetical protein